MAVRRPIVFIGGRFAELPAADTLPGGGSGAGYYEGPTAPNPAEFPLWFNTTDGVFLVYADLAWVEPGANFLPSGGTVGQMVVKASGVDFDYELVDPPEPSVSVSPILSWMI